MPRRGHFAEEAARLAPRVGWAGRRCSSTSARRRLGRGARHACRQHRQRLVDKAKAKRLRAVLLDRAGDGARIRRAGQARALAVEAHKLAPDLVPAATVAARLFARHGDIRRASRILEATWKISPHPEIAEAYADVRPGDSARDRLKRVMRGWRSCAPTIRRARWRVARAAIDAHDWQAARNALGGAMRANPTERVCLLMAEIEEGEHGDQGGCARG
jgi:HemY protein